MKKKERKVVRREKEKEEKERKLNPRNSRAQYLNKYPESRKNGLKNCKRVRNSFSVFCFNYASISKAILTVL